MKVCQSASSFSSRILLVKTWKYFIWYTILYLVTINRRNNQWATNICRVCNAFLVYIIFSVSSAHLLICWSGSSIASRRHLKKFRVLTSILLNIPTEQQVENNNWTASNAHLHSRQETCVGMMESIAFCTSIYCLKERKSKNSSKHPCEAVDKLLQQTLQCTSMLYSRLFGISNLQEHGILMK